MRLSLRRTITILLLLAGLLVGRSSVVPSPATTVSAQVPKIQSKQEARRQAAEAGQEVEDTWQVLYIGDQRIGYARQSQRNVLENDRVLIRTRSETHMAIKRFGQTLRMQTTLTTNETESGQLVSYTFEMKNPPADETRAEARIVERNDGTGQKQLLVETTVAGRTTKSGSAWDPAIKSPSYQDRLLRENPLKPGDEREFKTFDPQFNKQAVVRIVADRLRPTELHDGTRRDLLKVRITHSLLPGIPTDAWLDENGETVKTETAFLGQSLVTFNVSRGEALKAIEGKELDLAVDTLVRVLPPIRKPHQTRRVTYRVTTPGDDPTRHLVADATQQVKKIDNETAEVTVTALPLPTKRSTSRDMPDGKYTAATRFLQADDLRVRELARRCAAGENHPARIAGRMEEYVHRKLTDKNFSTALASAAEVARSLEGDCTEHAVLLAAMLRAENIPSRIAVGMVYVEREAAFGGHMWTEAWLDGRWVPLDATLGQGGIGAGHIKLAVSSFDDDGPAPVTTFIPLLKILGNMQIEVVDVQHK